MALPADVSAEPPPSPPGRPPGLIRRLAAATYDALLLFALLFAATAALLPFTGGRAIAPGHPLYATYLLAVGFAYFGWCWTHGGRTLGMQAWRMRVVSRDGGPATWPQAGVRFVVALASWLALGLGFLWIVVDRRRLAWHDHASATIVVHVPPPVRRATTARPDYS